MAIFYLLMSGLLISFAWPVRGQFGHEWGAMIPGCLAALICALKPSTGWRQSFAQAVIFSGLGFALGGGFGFGDLLDTILAASSLWDVIPELIHLTLIGAIWGLLGMTFLGFSLSELPNFIHEVFIFAGTGAAVYAAIEILKLPYEIIWLAGAGFLLHGYNALFKKSQMVWIFGIFGFLGFGLGLLVATIILWYGQHGYISGDWWSLRDQIWGFLGGVSVMLAVMCSSSKGLAPQPMASVNWQRAGLSFYLVFVTMFNTWNVYDKWFHSTPPVSNPVLWGSFLIACVLVLIGLLLYFIFCSENVFSGSALNQTLSWASLFFCWYLGILAIMKSIVYSGWSVWETAFTLFIIDSAIFTLYLPSIFKKEN